MSKERARPKELRLWEGKVFNARMEKCISSSPVLMPLQSVTVAWSPRRETEWIGMCFPIYEAGTGVDGWESGCASGSPLCVTDKM